MVYTGCFPAGPTITVSTLQFGISTHLYHDQRLGRDHLVEIAAHGFEAVEVFANRPHFDPADAGAVDELEESLRDAGLRLHAVHAPIADAVRGGAWSGALSIASSDEKERTRAVREVTTAVELARRMPFGYLVLHLGVPDAQHPAAHDNRPDAARRSLEEIQLVAEPLGVRLALEVMPNKLSNAGALVALLESDVELPGAGICVDFGHAFLMGDLLDEVELASGYIVTTHVHDNSGRADEHLVPFDGRIDWDAALMAVQKVGYDGALIFELAGAASTRPVLERAQRARRRLEQLLAG
jgi:sugar phosphate isomerase/epimerase